MLVKVDGKTYINNITIINNKKKKKKKKKNIYNRIHALQKILDKIFADQHNSNIKKLNKVHNI